jgi:antitoxin component YwqK of YwqJK toxin-antitoxin module
MAAEKFIGLLLSYCLFANCLSAQKLTAFSITISDTVINEDYGILYYEQYNQLIGGSQKRFCKTNTCNGAIEDTYPNGNIIHKGYYVEGVLKQYKNYYPDGTLERDFKITSLAKCELSTFHKNGKLRSRGFYHNGKIYIYEEFFENGNPEYYEEYDKSFIYYTLTKSYFENGKPESVLQITDTKKLFFEKREFFENGQVKEQGKLIFNKSYQDYQKHGIWLYYDEGGKIINETDYLNGKITLSRNY